MPRNHVNKNMLHKDSEFALFSAIKGIENTKKRYLNTVRVGVAAIIE